MRKKNSALGGNYDTNEYAQRQLGGMGQAMFDPPSVFSFYAPGPSPAGKSSLMNTATLLARWSGAYTLVRYPFGGCGTNASGCRAFNLGLNQFNVKINSTAEAPLTQIFGM